MKKQTVQTILLVLLLLGPVHGLIATVWHTVDYFTRLDAPYHAVLFLVKVPAFVGMLVIGFCLLQLIRAFSKYGYLKPDSVSLLRIMGISLFVIALSNSAFNVWRDEVVFPKLTTLPTLSWLCFRFTFDFLVESPATLLLSLAVFLLAAFVERALVVKSENEAFI